MKSDQDAFGLALERWLEDHDARIIVERDDGYIDSEGLGPYFAQFKDWWSVERQALRYVGGRVLDVGLGAGRVAVELQRRGHDVVGIDVSPLTVRVARRQGVKKAQVLRFEDVGPTLGTFDTVVLYMNNFGLFASQVKARQLLRKLHSLTSASGRIVATSSDPRDARLRSTLDYHRRNRARGRMTGQIRLRLRFDRRATPWFDYLFVSPTEMERLLAGTGWHVRRFIRREGESFYAAVIAKDA